MQINVLIETRPGLFIDNRARVTATLAEQVARNRYVGQLSTVSAPELGAMIDRILDYFNRWSQGDERGLKECLDFLENMCFALTTPLAEAAYALYVLRDGVAALLSAEAGSENTETIGQVNRFFEMLVRNLLRRY